MPPGMEKKVLKKHFKEDAHFEDTNDGGFVMRTTAGIRYVSGHGEFKCSPDCYLLHGNGPNGVPNNCAFHQHWLFHAVSSHVVPDVMEHFASHVLTKQKINFPLNLNCDFYFY